ncbi:MAG: helix-turn-helix domain-containing protein [Gemmobacter sp.]
MPYAVPMIRALSLMPAIRWLKTRDIDCGPFLQPFGLSSAPFGDPFRPIPLLHVGSFLRAIARKEGPDVACKIVAEANPTELALLGSVALGTRTPLEAFGRIAAVLPVFCSHEQLAIKIAPSFVEVWHSYTVKFDPETEHLLLQYAVAMADRLLSMTGTTGPRLAQVDMPPHPDFGIEHLKRWLGTVVRPSEGRRTRILVETAVAEKPFPRAARDRLLAGRLPALEPIRGDGSFGGSVKTMLASMLIDEMPTIRDMAKVSGTSVRTFQRRLSGEGLVYSDLVEEVRQAHALRLLSMPNATVKSVAGDLGYEYQSSFTRAMLRWTGASPKKFKMGEGKEE